jgi:hypothetical protein
MRIEPAATSNRASRPSKQLMLSMCAAMFLLTGLANAKTVDIRADGDSVAVTTKRSKTANQPAKSTNTAATKKHARRVVSAVGKNVGSYRPDLKVRSF